MLPFPGATTTIALVGQYGTTLTAHASANTKGSYTELEDATPYRINWLQFDMICSNDVDYLVDIVIGAAASEQIILANIPISRESGAFLYSTALLPVSIPAGVRVAARIQATTGGATLVINAHGMTSGAWAPGTLHRTATYGAATADSGGTSIDPGAVANTPGSYVEMSAASTFAHNWMVIGIGNQNNAARDFAFWALDIALGAGGSEQIIGSNYLISTDSTTDCVGPPLRSVPVQIPSGVRIAARTACSATDATDRLFDLILLAA